MNGVAAAPECFTAYEEMKMRKTDKFIVFKLSDDLRQIEVEKRGGSDASFEDFVAAMPPGECRYVVLSLSVTTKSGATDPHRLLFVSWCHDDSRTKAKMMHASSKSALKKGLSGLSEEFCASSHDDLTFEELYLKSGGVPPCVPPPAAGSRGAYVA